MNPRDFTADQVRVELESLIENYPDNNGRVMIQKKDYLGRNEVACVYFLDENGDPITASSTYGTLRKPVFKTPVCIVGQWLEDFHPNLKNNDLIKNIILKNMTLNTLFENEIPFEDSVLELLGRAQRQQDSLGKVWSDIEL